jgi:uncharacterized protein (TIGR03067 family)
MCIAIACLTFVPLTLFSPGLARDDRAVQEQLAALQGVWKVTTLETDGKPAKLPVDFWWFIKGDKVRYGGQELAGLTLDVTTKPRCIDLKFHNPDRVYEGIYTVESDRLRLCVNSRTEGVKKRPLEYTTKGKSDFRLLVFKRDKDREGDDVTGLGGYVGISIKAQKGGKGVLITDVVKDSPAQKAGLKRDDLLLKVGDLEAGDLQSVVAKTRAAAPGTELALRVKRDDKEQDVTVKVGVVPFFLLD